MRNLKQLTIIPLIIAALLTFSAGECKKSNTDPTKPKPTLTDKLNLLEVNAKIIIGQVKGGVVFVRQLKTQFPQLQAIVGFNDEIALAESGLNELDGACDPFFEAVKAFAATKDKASLIAALDNLKGPVQRLRPHVDALVKMIAEYINEHGGDVNLERIQTGIGIARLAFDGALEAVPLFIK